MKGFNIGNNTFKDKLLNQYNNEYGLNLYTTYEKTFEEYDRFFKTKNNLEPRKDILSKK